MSLQIYEPRERESERKIKLFINNYGKVNKIKIN